MAQAWGWTTQTVRPPPRRVVVREDVEPAPRPAWTVLPCWWVVEKTHVQNAFRKLNVSRRVQLLRFPHTSPPPPAVSPLSAPGRDRRT
jgi:hypothetical protein